MWAGRSGTPDRRGERRPHTVVGRMPRLNLWLRVRSGGHATGQRQAAPGDAQGRQLRRRHGVATGRAAVPETGYEWKLQADQTRVRGSYGGSVEDRLSKTAGVMFEGVSDWPDHTSRSSSGVCTRQMSILHWSPRMSAYPPSETGSWWRRDGCVSDMTLWPAWPRIA